MKMILCKTAKCIANASKCAFLFPMLFLLFTENNSWLDPNNVTTQAREKNTSQKCEEEKQLAAVVFATVVGNMRTCDRIKCMS